MKIIVEEGTVEKKLKRANLQFDLKPKEVEPTVCDLV